MLLAVDAGNTQTVFGLFEDGELGEHWRVATERDRTGDELGVLLSGLLDLDSVDGICLSSTVPPLVQAYEDFGERWAHAPVLVVGPGARTGIPIRYDDPRDLLGRKQMKWAKQQLSSSKAAWKVVGSEVMMMPAKVLGGSYYTFDSWQGYQTEREELLAHIKDQGVDDVVFVTGDIHTFIAGDVRTEDGAGETVATEFVGGSITSQSLGETNLEAGGGVVIPGNDADPNTPQALIDALRGINPWVDQADFDHHGFGKIKADANGLTCELVRMQTIKKRSTATLPSPDLTYTLKRGQTSIKGVHGPAAA